MEKHYDFVAIGGGSAGFNAAVAALEHTDRVALIDGASELGGLCILRGCMPSKTLIHVADTMHHIRNAGRLGIEVGSATVNMRAVRERKRRIIGEFADYRVQAMQKAKFDLLRHQARFVGPNRLELDNGDVIVGEKILIGTGSVVSWPDIPGLRESKPWTSDDVLELDFVPESVIVLGGGVVACELAQYLARMGTRVIQVQRSPVLLKEMPADAASVVAQAFRDEGIDLYTGTRLQSVEFDGIEYTVRFEHDGEVMERRARHCLNALGRTPNTASLNLEAAGIERLDSGHIRTNAYQQTTNPSVYAAGDCAGPFEIVHVAIQQATVAVRHAFGRDPEPIDYSAILQVVFTDPQVATVGKSEDELRRTGTPYLSASYPFDDHGKSILMEATYGFVKVLADPADGHILGAEIVGRDAGEMIHVFAVAVANRLTAHDLLKTPWYHPTMTEIVTYPLEEIAENLAD